MTAALVVLVVVVVLLVAWCVLLTRGLVNVSRTIDAWAHAVREANKPANRREARAVAARTTPRRR